MSIGVRLNFEMFKNATTAGNLNGICQSGDSFFSTVSPTHCPLPKAKAAAATTT
jgi:hypothetical protein